MSGFMRKAALVVGAVALVAATAGAAGAALAPGLAGSASVAGVSTATLTAIGTYGGLAAGVLSAVATATAPGVSSQGSATTFQTNPQSGLPYAMGRTRMSGLRIFADTNTRPGYTKFNDLLWFGAMLSIGGPIEQIETFTADNEVVTFDASGNANGTYHDYQAQKVHLGGPQASALALTLGGGAAPGWTSQHRLSGITHAMWCLRYNKQGEMYGAGAPEPAWTGKWVKVYDPRLDSTYPGGSGSCRALVETTYVWSDNPGLHALTWALGRWQNGKRTCGIGAPVSTIRIADFVECANVCEANGWKVGGVEWTTDSKWDTMKRILQAGGARPTKTGAMIGCMVSTPRTAIATIESRHLLDSLSIAATKGRRDRFNSVIPRYVDEDSDWSVVSGTAITVPEYVDADRGQRTKEIDYPLVQVFSGDDATQPGQLAAYDIVNSREAGPIDFTTGPEWVGLKTGDVVLLHVPEEGLVNQPILITRRSPDPSTGKVTFSAQTETLAKHAYALGQSTTPPAPFSLTAPDLKPPAPSAANWSAAGTVTGEGLPAIVVTGTSEMPSADALLIDYRLSSDEPWTRSAILSAKEAVQHVIAPLESETAYDVRIGYRVEQIDGEFTILSAFTGVGKLSGIEDGATNGASPEEKDQLAQLEADTAAAQVRMEQAEQDIADLFDTYGDSASAAQSALAAAQSAQTAQDATDNAEQARDLAQDARAAADAAVSDASDYADAAGLSATASSTAKTAAETAKTAAETARTQAQTARTDAQTAFNNSATARDASVAAKTASELARDNAQTYASNADGSATAAAGYASTASNKATDAGNSATAAAASVVSSQSLYNSNLTLAYVSAPLLISGFAEGAKHWTNSRFGNPVTVAGATGAAASDSALGPVLEITDWSAAGNNILSKGVIAVQAGRIYEVSSTFKITGSDGSVLMNLILGSMVSGYGSAATSAILGPSVACDGNGTYTLTRKFALGGVTGITPIPSDVVLVRPGLRLSSAEAGLVLRVAEIRINDVTERETATEQANAAATSASAASTSAGLAGQSATASQQSATNASTSAGNASTSAGQASTSATNAAGSASAAQTSQGAAATSATNAGNSANAASTSAQTASTKATEAGQSASAASASATTASTKAGEASTSATNAASSATTAQGHASNASTSAGAAATSATNASNSAGAASTSAQTASTKATEAGQSATAAAGSATNAASSYSSAVAVVLTSLPEKYTAASDPYFSLSHVGSPQSLTPALSNATAADGTPVYALVAGSGQNLNWAQRGVFPAVAGRTYEVEVEYQVLAVSGAATVSTYVRSLDASYASITSSGAQIASAVGTYTSKHLVANPTPSDPGSLSWHSSAVWLRAFLNVVAPTGASISVQARRIRVSDVTAREAAKSSASAAATSATTASTKATQASQSADSAAGSALTASTKAGDALASQQAAASSASDALGYRNSASSSATLAAQSKNDANDSAIAAAGSASTASTNATNAGQSATSASNSAVAASATFANLKNTVANQSQALPYDFKDGNAFWTNDRTGAPDSRPTATGTLITNDPLLGQCWEITDWSTAGHNILTRGVMPVIAGRFYEVRARFRVTSGSPANFNAIASGMAADYTATGAAFRGGPAITAGSGGVFEAVALFSDTTANDATAFTSDAVFARFGLRLAQSKAVTVRVQSIRVTDVTEKLAAANSATAASGSASSAAGSATAAGASASSASGSANTASTKAGEAANSASAAQTSAGAASSSSTSAAQSASAAASNKVAAEIAATNAAYLDAGYVADFTGSALNGFAASNATLTTTVNGLVIVPTTGDPFVYKNGLSIQGSSFTRVLIELTRSAPSMGAWDGSLYWATSGHGWSGSYRAFAVQGEPVYGSATTLVFDMPNAADGADDWMSSTITGLRFDLDSTLGGGRQSVIRSIRVMGPDSAAPAKLASAAATSETNAAGSATAAGNSAGAAATSATNAASSAGAASTSAGNASTSAGQASTSATNAAGSASAASTSATNAANSATNASNSATAAAGSASTASTKASEAGQSATAAAASAVSANSTYNAMVQSQAASPVLPSDFSDGMNQWVDDRYGSPQSLPNSTGQIINGDGNFGRCADYAWTSIGQNVLTRGTMQLIPGRFYEVRARFRVRSGDGSHTFNIVAAWLDASYAGVDWVGAQTTTVGGGTTEIVALFSDTTANGATAWPSSAVYGRFGLRLNGSESGMIVRIGTIRVIDVTEKLSASNSANAASTSATNAATSATNAGTSATAASGHANTAQTKAGDAAASASSASSSAAAASSSASSASSSASQASTFKGQAESAASTATSQATVATNAAAAASSSATVSARVAASSLNPNPVFAGWPNGQSYPADYSSWGNFSSAAKITGAQSPYALRTTMSSNTDTEGGGAQSNTYVANQAIQNNMWLVLEVDARRVSGNMKGACALFRVTDSSGSTAQNFYVDLYADADIAGVSGNAGTSEIRRWRRLVQVTSSSAYGFKLFLMNRFGGAPSYTTAATSNQIEWHKVSFRPATDQEIAAKQATQDISSLAATVTTQAQTLSDLSGSYASLSNTVTTQGVTITNQSSAISTIQDNVSSLFARNAMTIAAGNVITGWENSTNGTVSSFKIRADVFELVPSSSSGERTSFSGGAWRGWDANNVKRWQLGKQD